MATTGRFQNYIEHFQKIWNLSWEEKFVSKLGIRAVSRNKKFRDKQLAFCVVFSYASNDENDDNVFVGHWMLKFKNFARGVRYKKQHFKN